MATVLTINGSTITRPNVRLVLDQLQLSIDRHSILTFTEIRNAAGTGSYSAGQSVTLSIDGTTRFTGQIVSASPVNVGTGCINVHYTAYGLRFLANNLFITGSDGTGLISWNLHPTDPDYLSTRAGQSIGDIIQEILDLHQTALTAVGFANPCYVSSELTALTVVTPEPVYVAGRVIDAVEDLLREWMPAYQAYVDESDQLIHIKNTRSLTALTLTLDSDPVTIDNLTKDHGECFTKVVLRGQADIQAAYLSTSEGTLEQGWTSTEQADWTIQDFWQPKDAASIGDVNSMTSTVLTVQSDVSTETWATNYWNGIGAEVWAFDPAATGITFGEQRAITACTSLSAGGTSTITVDPAFSNSGYTRYVVRGTRTSESLVWRKYTIAPTWIAQHLVRRFNKAVPWAPTDGAVALTYLPVGNVCWSLSGSPPYFEFPWPFETVLYDGTTDGYIIFGEPTPKAYTSQSDLEAGGGSVVAPADVKVLVAYSRGPLTATAPSSGYEGTAYTTDGVDRVYYRDYPDWVDSNNSSAMSTLAQQILDSLKDTVIEGTATYHGKLSTALTLGRSLDIARSGGTTGWESIAAPIRTITLNYQDRSAIWTTRLDFSTRRRPFTGDRLYTRGQTYQQQWGGWAPGFGTWDPFASMRENMPSFDMPQVGQMGGIPQDIHGGPDAIDQLLGRTTAPPPPVKPFVGPPSHLKGKLSPEDQAIDDHLKGLQE